MGKREGLFLIKKKLAAQSNGMGDQFHDTRLHLDYSTCHPGMAQPSACPAGHHDFTLQCCEWRRSSRYFTSLSYHKSLQLKTLGNEPDFLTAHSPARGQPHCTRTAGKRPGSSWTAASEHKSKLQEEFSSHLSISLHIFWNVVTNSWYLLSSNEQVEKMKTSMKWVKGYIQMEIAVKQEITNLKTRTHRWLSEKLNWNWREWQQKATPTLPLVSGGTRCAPCAAALLFRW